MTPVTLSPTGAARVQAVSSSEDFLLEPPNSLCDFALRYAIAVLFVDNWLDLIGRGGSTARFLVNETVAFFCRFSQTRGRFIFNVTPCLKPCASAPNN